MARRARVASTGTPATIRPAHFQEKSPNGRSGTDHDEITYDQRRNQWEELLSYRDAAKLTDEQWTHLLSDLADLVDKQRAWETAQAKGPMPPDTAEERARYNASYAANGEAIADELEARAAYLSDEQWRVFRARFRSSHLVFMLAMDDVLARDGEPARTAP